MAFFRANVTRIFLILLAVLFVLCAVFFLWQRRGKETTVPTVYTVVFETEEVRLSSIAVGDALIDACGKEAAGEVLAVSHETALGEDAYGVYGKEGRVRVKLSVLARGVKTESGVRVGTLTARAGERLYLCGRTRIEGLCVRVRAL